MSGSLAFDGAMTARVHTPLKGKKETHDHILFRHYRSNLTLFIIFQKVTNNIFRVIQRLERVEQNLPSRVVTQASMASKVTKLNMREGEVDVTGRQTTCLSHLLSLCVPLSSVCMPPRRQGQMVTVTVPVLVRPEAPSRSTTGTYRVSREEEKPGRGSRADWSTKLAVTPDNVAKNTTHIKHGHCTTSMSQFLLVSCIRWEKRGKWQKGKKDLQSL